MSFSVKENLNIYPLPFIYNREIMRTYKEYLLENFKHHKKNYGESSYQKQFERIQRGIERIKYIQHPTLRIQKYVIKHRPDLIKYINNLDPILRKQHAHEIGLSGIEI
jgi:hypothetical protein